MDFDEFHVAVDVACGHSCRGQGPRHGGPPHGTERRMRRIRATEFVTLDGVVQGLGRPDEDTRGGFTHGGWGPRYNDEVMGRELAEGMARPGDMLFGRTTWQDFTA